MDLITAVRTNNLERVRLLVEQGADKEEGDSGGNTPLYWASVHGHLDVVQFGRARSVLGQGQQQ